MVLEAMLAVSQRLVEQDILGMSNVIAIHGCQGSLAH